MGSKTTKYDLEHVTDYLAFESLCHDLMSRAGYKSIQPLGGYADKGRDAIHYDKSTSVSTVFAYSVRKDWEEKLNDDLETVSSHGHECDQFVFVTTCPVTTSQFDKKRDKVRQSYGWKLDIFDLERVSTLIDSHYRDLIALHSNIFHISSKIPSPDSAYGFDPQHYAGYLLGSYELWVEQYTPLLAEHKEMDTFVDLYGEDDAVSRLPVADIPESGSISVLLGESGAGKTTSLWKIVVQFCRRLKDGSGAKVPVLFDLRGWSHERNCRDLFQEQFALLDIAEDVVEQELKGGSFLVLLDGINEVSQVSRKDCRYDVASFMSSYPANRYVVSCRNSDFHSSLIPTREVKPPLPDPDVYEICRLDRDQIAQYSETYFAQRSTSPNKFFDRLRLHDDRVWEDKTSVIQLARIPLYLQLFLDVFHQTNQLPSSRANLLKALVDRILDREESRGDVGVDRFANERMLGQLAFRSTGSDYSLRFPERYALEQIVAISESLKARGIITGAITFGQIWRHILSGNFLKSVSGHSVEWIHQLVRDYFLGAEYARIWETEGATELQSLKQRLISPAWDIACTIALGLLDKRHGASFLWYLVYSCEENARIAFEGQTAATRATLIDSLVREVLEKGDYDTKALRIISCALPYPEVAETLDSNFYSTASIEMRILLIEAISQTIMEHYPKLQPSGYPNGDYLDPGLQEARNQVTKAAVRRCEELLRKYLRNKNEIVSFHAVKGLWERDRSASVEQLKKLHHSRNPEVVSMAQDLIDEWGIT